MNEHRSASYERNENKEEGTEGAYTIYDADGIECDYARTENEAKWIVTNIGLMKVHDI